MNHLRISVIIPVFNAVNTLENTLNSVFEQTYPSIEVIVVDGMSTDGSWEVIHSFKEKISVLIQENDRGVYDAMNKGVGRATGDFFYFLGADDVLDNNEIISKMFDGNTDPSVKIVFGDVRNVGAKTNKIPAIHRADFSKKIYWKNTLHHQGVFYHCSVFKSFRYDEQLAVLADYELNIKLFCQKVNWVKKPLIVARCSAQGLSKNFNQSLYREELVIKKRQLPFFMYLIQIPWVWLKYGYKSF